MSEFQNKKQIPRHGKSTFIVSFIRNIGSTFDANTHILLRRDQFSLTEQPECMNGTLSRKH